MLSGLLVCKTRSFLVVSTMPDASINPRAVIGGNYPPPSPLEIVTKEVEDIYGEAVQWLDGLTIDSQDLADGVAHMLTMLRAAEKHADEARRTEKQPHMNAAKAVDEAYKPIIDKAKLATETCKTALKPWLKQQEAEKRAAAEKARQEAEAKTIAARQAIQATDSTNLEARAVAEELVKDAKRAERAADRASNDTAKAGTLGRAVSLRTTYVAVMTNSAEALRFYKQTNPDAIKATLQSLAERDVRAGKRQIPGFEIVLEHKAV